MGIFLTFGKLPVSSRLLSKAVQSSPEPSTHLADPSRPSRTCQIQRALQSPPGKSRIFQRHPEPSTPLPKPARPSRTCQIQIQGCVNSLVQGRPEPSRALQSPPESSRAIQIRQEPSRISSELPKTFHGMCSYSGMPSASLRPVILLNVSMSGK